jgi:hypothetical protein
MHPRSAPPLRGAPWAVNLALRNCVALLLWNGRSDEMLRPDGVTCTPLPALCVCASTMLSDALMLPAQSGPGSTPTTGTGRFILGDVVVFDINTPRC